MEVQVPVSVGELIDKLTILEIKVERISDPKKKSNILRELESLRRIVDEQIPGSPELDELRRELKQVNEILWKVEDRLRDFERAKNFSQAFIADARSVYFTNDRRSEIKRKINHLLGSAIIEEKSYQAY